MYLVIIFKVYKMLVYLSMLQTSETTLSKFNLKVKKKIIHVKRINTLLYTCMYALERPKRH